MGCSGNLTEAGRDRRVAGAMLAGYFAGFMSGVDVVPDAQEDGQRGDGQSNAGAVLKQVSLVPAEDHAQELDGQYHDDNPNQAGLQVLGAFRLHPLGYRHVLYEQLVETY